MKKCPYCAEDIQDGAVKCRFCNEFIKKPLHKNCFLNCLVVVMISSILAVLFLYLSFAAFKFIFYKMFFAGSGFPQQRHLPLTGYGIEGALKEFGDVFRAIWEMIKNFFLGRPQYNNIVP